MLRPIVPAALGSEGILPIDLQTPMIGIVRTDGLNSLRVPTRQVDEQEIDQKHYNEKQEVRTPRIVKVQAQMPDRGSAGCCSRSISRLSIASVSKLISVRRESETHSLNTFSSSSC